MAELRGDQAEGLRRMLARNTARIITLVSGCNGVGKSSVAVNLATVLAARGARVLLIDENRGPASSSAMLGVPPCVALEPTMCHEFAIEEALVPTAYGVIVFPAAGVLHALPSVAKQRLIANFGGVDRRFDVVLVDTPCGQAGSTEMFVDVLHDTIVVSSAATRAVTASYALIKRLHNADGQHRFHVLLNRVVAEGNARVILDNLLGLARSHLQLPIESLGCVPKDESLRLASIRPCPVLDAYPSSPSAARFRGIADAIAGWPGARARHGLIDRFMQSVRAGSSPVLANAGV